MATTFKSYVGALTGVEQQSVADDLSEETDDGCSDCGLAHGTVAGSSAAMAGIAIKNTSAMASALVAKASTELRTRLDPSRGLLPSRTLAQAGLSASYGGRHPQSARGLAPSLLAGTPLSLTEGLQRLSAQGLFEPVGTVSPVRGLGGLQGLLGSTEVMKAGGLALRTGPTQPSVGARIDAKNPGCLVGSNGASGGQAQRAFSAPRRAVNLGTASSQSALYDRFRTSQTSISSLGIGLPTTIRTTARYPSPYPYPGLAPAYLLPPHVPATPTVVPVAPSTIYIQCHVVMPYDPDAPSFGMGSSGGPQTITQTGRTNPDIPSQFYAAIPYVEARFRKLGLRLLFNSATDVTEVPDARLYYDCNPNIEGQYYTAVCKSNWEHRADWVRARPSLFHNKMVFVCRRTLVNWAEGVPVGSLRTWRRYEGGGASWVDWPHIEIDTDYINPWTLAHEIGHFLGLTHTFKEGPDQPRTFDDMLVQVRDYMIENRSETPEQALNFFYDGDGILDTGPHPQNWFDIVKAKDWCDLTRRSLSFPIGNEQFALRPPVTNLMAYESAQIEAEGCGSPTLTDDQIDRMRDVLISTTTSWERHRLFLALN